VDVTRDSEIATIVGRDMFPAKTDTTDNENEPSISVVKASLAGPTIKGDAMVAQ